MTRKIKLPNEVFVFNNVIEDLLTGIAEVTDGNVVELTDGFARSWFYDAEKLVEDYPAAIQKLWPFLAKVEIAQTND